MKQVELGIEVLDVQLKRIDYNKEVRQKLFNRMITAQNTIAEKYRAQGEGSKQEILGKQIQKEKEIISVTIVGSFSKTYSLDKVGDLDVVIICRKITGRLINKTKEQIQSCHK